MSPVIAVALVCGAIVAGCVGCGDGESEDRPEPVEGVGELRGGSSAPLAQCSDWREGTVEERLVTVSDLRDQLTPQGVANPEAALPDSEAYRLLDRACEPEYAVGFRLYRLYANAAAFAPLRGEPTE
ncbi:MAG: hypothetical protein ACRDKX_02410 [Solirubrobacterales bacterium]